MNFRFASLAALCVLCLSMMTTTAAAQQVEASFDVGYTGSEGIDSDHGGPLLGQRYDSLDVESGASVGFTVGVLFGEHMEGEFLWSRQNSRLSANGASTSLPLSELAIHNYMGNFVYNWGPHDGRLRPFAFAGIGATQYAFGDNLLPNATGNLSSDTRFASNIGGGIKAYLAPRVGLRTAVRWTPTYIKSTSAGVWCDPFYGCWPVVDNQYSNQFDTSVGVTFRF